MDCVDVCKHGAIRFQYRFKKTAPQQSKETLKGQPADQARRQFLSVTAGLAATATLKAQEKKVDGGLAVIEDKKIPERKTRIVPPGSTQYPSFCPTLYCLPVVRIGLPQ